MRRPAARSRRRTQRGMIRARRKDTIGCREAARVHMPRLVAAHGFTGGHCRRGSGVVSVRTAVHDRPSAEGAAMAATPLPAGRRAPRPGTVKTCDASGMIEIHRMFRRRFGEGPALVRARRAPATSATRRRWRHSSTTTLARPARAPRGRGRAALGRARGARTVVRRARRAHEGAARRDARAPDRARRGASGMAGERIGRGCRARARRARRDQRGARRAPARRGDEHRAGDGDHDHPEGGRVVRRARSQARSPRARPGTQLGEILAAQPDGGDEWLHKHMPPPARLMWRWIGKPKYAKHSRAALERRR